LFAGCRVDETRRLEVDCMQRDEGCDEKTGETFPICLLRVPQNKTSRPFTKPVDPIVGQLIGAWKHVRPPQPKIVDRKTGEHREFLFCVRGTPIGREYLNDTVLPALCHIPETDSRGALTSHRARSTIATQLLNAPEPLSLADLKEWLGHKHFSSTRHYAAILQRRRVQAITAAPRSTAPRSPRRPSSCAPGHRGRETGGRPPPICRPPAGIGPTATPPSRCPAPDAGGRRNCPARPVLAAADHRPRRGPRPGRPEPRG
jgi:hypothetical protein